MVSDCLSAIALLDIHIFFFASRLTFNKLTLFLLISLIGVPSLFNLLPTSLCRKNVGADPLTAFKTALDKFLGTIPDQPTIPELS